MRNVHQAIAELGSAIGLADAELDDAGNLTLIVDGDLSVNIATVDEETLEFWVRLPDLGSASDASFLAFLLISNHLGEGAGGGRLALTPDRSAAVLCERVRIGGLDGDATSARLADFIRYATFWRSPEARRAAGSSSSSGLPTSHENSFVIRA